MYVCVVQIFSAPFFVVLELMFACGYKPELRQECDVQIKANIAELEALEAKSRSKKARGKKG